MILARLLRPLRDAGWRDAPDDATVADLARAAAAELPDARRRVERSRSLVLAEFAASTADARRPVIAAPWRPSRPRRFAFALLTATMVLAVSAGGIAASAPGLPAYSLRLAVEELLLPNGAGSRLAAQVERLERRLDEASAAGDSRAGRAAALEAYADIAEDVAAMRPEASAVAGLAARITTQVHRLERLQASAEAGSDDALRSAHRLLVWIGAGQGDGKAPRPAPGGQATPSAEPSTSPSGTPLPAPSPNRVSPTPGSSDGEEEPSSQPPAPRPTGSPRGNGEPGKPDSGGWR